MKKFLTVTFSFAVLIGLTGLVAAQESGEVNAADPGTTIEVDGELEVRNFYRDENIRAVLNSSTVGAQRNQWDTYAQYNVGLEASLTEQVTARVEFENQPIDDSLTGGADSIGGIIGNETADAEATSTRVGQAWVEAGNFLADNLSMKAGIQDYDTDLRGNGNAFLIDLRNSEAVFDDTRLTLQENHSGGIYNGKNMNRESGGFLFNFSLNNRHDLDLFYFQVNDDADTSGGRDDEALWGGVLKGELQNESSWLAAFNVFAGDDGNTSVWNLGGGVDYYVGDTGEVYGELYFQGGTYRDQAQGITGTGDQDHSSFGGYLGYEHSFGNGYVDGTFMYLGGDDGSDTGTLGTTAQDGNDNEDFVSMEDNDSTMIMEDNVLGLDVDTNYLKFQVDLGTEARLMEEGDLNIEFTLAHFLAETETLDGTGSSLDDTLGTEADLTFTWMYSENLDFDLGLAQVFSGDFWDQAAGYNVDDSMALYTFGANLNF